MAIREFTGEWEFLSNFAPAFDNGLTVEHLYQAAKTGDRTSRDQILKSKTPGQAKRLGNLVPLRKDWEEMKVPVMRSLLMHKFKDQKLMEMLLDTGDQYLEEGNNWHDNFWGNCRCEKCRHQVGENRLGRLLMDVRVWYKTKNC